MNWRLFHAWAALLLMLLMAVATKGDEAKAEPMAERDPAAVKRWQEWRFGMFIHWGPVSLKETEISWSRANSNPKCPNHGPIPVDVYDNLYKQFNPVKFDARQWVAIARAAGMKYMVLTAKHCDGFLLWDSKVSDYNIMHTPFHRDVCAELARAAHEAGMGLGWYFSPMDWRDPDFRTERNAAFLARMQGEIRELLTQYGKIDILWFDWDGRQAVYDQPNTYALVRRLQPEIMLTNRLDLSEGNNNRQMLSPFADFFTPEQSIGGFDNRRPWESCMTISRRGQWAWGGAKDGVKSFPQCMNMLIRCAGGDGNTLLNVGPTPSGEIASDQAERLKEMGQWLAKYGESIYRTRGGPFKPGEFGCSTHRGQTVFLHIQQWPDGPLVLPAIPAKIVRNQVLTGGRANVTQTAASVEIAMPPGDRQETDTIIALELDCPAGEIAPVATPQGERSLAEGKKATASNVYRKLPAFGTDKAIDGRSETRWATDGGTKSAWLEVDLGRPARIGHAVIKQAYAELNRIRTFAIESWQDDGWKPCYRSTGLGTAETFRAKFDPITARRVRLNILEATDGPTISEFELFPPKP